MQVAPWGVFFVHVETVRVFMGRRALCMLVGFIRRDERRYNACSFL